MPLYWLMKLNMTKERSRNIISHSTDFSTTTIKQQQQQQQNHQYSQHLEDNMGHISTLGIVETTTEVIEQNDKTQNQNFNEKSILSDKNLCNNNSNNNNNNKKDNQNAINNNNNFNNYNNDNGAITTTTSSSNNNLFDQNNNDGKKYKTIVTNKSKLNICNNEKCKNIKLSSSSSSSIDKTLKINENNVIGSNINDNKSSDNNGNEDDDNGKLLRRSCLNEKIYEDWKGDKVFGIQFKAPLKWDKIFAITALHLVFLYCVFTYTSEHHNWKTTIWAILCGGFAGFGVTAGAHRLWTHRAYKATTFLRILLIMCFSLSGQNTLYDWVRDHRVHHKFSETDADPHNANRGFFFAHVGWLMMYKHPDVIKRGRQMDMTDILSDPVVQFHQRNFVIMKTLFCFVLPIIPPVLFWHDTLYNAIVTQCIFRYVLCLNFTWSVNSAAHMWGTRPYDRKIQPAENLIVSLLAFGEGWHNYHHVFPWDYKAAELGNYSVNLSTLFIDLFSKLGWAYDMKQPSKELIRRTIEKCGDGTHPVFGHHLSEVPIPAEENIDENLNVYEKTY